MMIMMMIMMMTYNIICANKDIASFTDEKAILNLIVFL
jgi:hypothetical protein